MSELTEAKVRETFAIFDVDHSNVIDKQEAVKHWNTKFGRISATEFFNTVDVNHDGKIDYKEFLQFWEIVHLSGHSEEEICDELDNI